MASVLSALEVSKEDKIIAIRENKLADSNFIITNLMLNCFNNDETVCLVILHNTLGHYHNVGKRLGFDFLNKIKDGRAKVIEPLKEIADEISAENKKYLLNNKELIVKNLFLEIKQMTDELLKSNRRTTLFIDDVSHLFDLGIDLKHVISFIRYCNGLTIQQDLAVVMNCHVASEVDEIISNIMFHAADLAVVVSGLKTGRSRTVSGILTVQKQSSLMKPTSTQNLFHFKLTEKEVNVFHPGRLY